MGGRSPARRNTLALLLLAGAAAAGEAPTVAGAVREPLKVGFIYVTPIGDAG